MLIRLMYTFSPHKKLRLYQIFMNELQLLRRRRLLRKRRIKKYTILICVCVYRKCVLEANLKVIDL